MKRFFSSASVILIVMTMLGVTAHAQKKAVDSKTTYAKEVLQPYVDSGQLPGAICILYKDGIQETCCIGYADAAAKRPITMDDVFMQCSQTKGFCGVTIAKLVEEGKISLDDPVSKYLHEFKELWVLDEEKDGVKTLHKAKNVLTVRMVLNHTGGFPFECSAKRRDVRGGGWSGGAPLRQVASIAAAISTNGTQRTTSQPFLPAVSSAVFAAVSAWSPSSVSSDNDQLAADVYPATALTSDSEPASQFLIPFSLSPDLFHSDPAEFFQKFL